MVVWFTPEIPLAFGPAGLGGLPGLLVEATKYRYTLIIKKIRYFEKDLTIDKRKEGKMVTAEDLKEM